MGPRGPVTAATFARRVQFRDVLWFAGALVVPAVVGVAGLLAAAALGVLGQRGFLIWFLPVAALLSGLATWLVARRRGWGWRDLGLVRGRRSPWHLAWEVPVAWLVAVVPAIAVASAIGLQPSARSDTATQEAIRFGPPASMVLTVLAVAVVVPLLEEVVFRRMLYGWLEGWAGWPVAVVGSTLCFAAAHGIPVVMVIVGAVGLAAAVLVRVHRSLWPGLVLHSANNLLVAVLVLAGLR
ncbi:CPBP family intramembrane glutamic endopeptidase [Ornithinicoccus halotolerans]|uniref:CPBP family intramembrane glutamic endopeptidase n=1 Tax=Ornithinicoccus halotolerans TaxID=1748220 RepID=UPI0012954518|nr:CPBP family intramembrane glutamic endopeptidase [Ornithinicoccus halotolerans]